MAKKKEQEQEAQLVEETEAVEEKKKTSKAKAEKKETTVKKTKKAEKETEKKPSAKSKLEELKERAKAMEERFKESADVDIKGELTGEKDEKKDTLVPMEDYLKSSIHLGTRVITPHMRKYVYRRRADGLAVFNTALLDDKIREAADYLAKYAPEDIVVICKREVGWKPVIKFAETLGIKYFTKKYPAGTLTNPNLVDFFEKELVFICDPWLDKNALSDANKIKIPVFSICDTNNFTFGIEQILPGNNKSGKSIGMIFYLLTKLYIEKRGLDVQAPPIHEFVDDWDNLEPPK